MIPAILSAGLNKGVAEGLNVFSRQLYKSAAKEDNCMNSDYETGSSVYSQELRRPCVLVIGTDINQISRLPPVSGGCYEHNNA